mmetsp:Transcript_16501/g.29933  ORF Transcript_16501/g.29933 Transcript_16501/m.29933 type:complete len:251 (-) Transcript_16501:1214-1966(-)
MASRNLDGCRVMKEAEQRLAFAQESEKRTQGQLEAAKTQLKVAKTQLEVDQNEVKKKKSFLEETREKLQVIDVDEDDDTESGDGKRTGEVKLSPNHGSGKKARTDSNMAAASQPSVVPASDTSNGEENVVEQIVVEGAGVSEVNGTYKRCQPSYHDFPFSLDKNVPVYSKSGSWKGNAAKFSIYRQLGYWWVTCGDQDSAGACCSTSTMRSLYGNSRSDTNLPPKNDWYVLTEGSIPSPQLKWYKCERGK